MFTYMSRLSDPLTQPVLFSPVDRLDVTAVCILEAFQNQQSMLLADKVLKQLGKEKAKEKYKVNIQLVKHLFQLHTVKSAC